MIHQCRFVQVVVGSRHVWVIVPFGPEKIEGHRIDSHRILGGKKARSPLPVEGVGEPLAGSMFDGMYPGVQTVN